MVANTEKEVFTCTTGIYLQNVVDQINTWSLNRNLSTLIPPYTIIRHNFIVPFATLEEFSRSFLSNKSHLNINVTDKEHWYILDELNEGDTYEVRVSYAATSPTNFVQEILDIEALSIFLRNRGDFKELNQESEMKPQKIFTTTRFLRVRGIYDGYSIFPGKEYQPVKYNIERLMLLGVPRVAFKLILLLGFSILFTYFVITPKIWAILVKIRDEPDENIDKND
ncbi:hypothetical protein G9A89_017929 [Geosiphon pyriformis]|nr:hypothetical protein G9A89_017929 [Geosiphon pyriformis]